MVRVRYSLEDFVHEMTDLVAARPDHAALLGRGSSLVERLVRDPGAIPEEFCRPAPSAGRRSTGYLLHRGPGLLVTTVVWSPGAHAGPHDHHTWGIIGVLQNGIQETRFRRVDDRDRADYARLARDRVALVQAGEVSLLTPEIDEIHQMDNLSDRPTIEIHVYGADLVGLDRCRYDLESGRITPFASGKFANC